MPRELAYVTAGGATGVTVIDVANDAVHGAIPVGNFVEPTDVVFSPDQRHAYVTTARVGESGKLEVIDTIQETVVDSIDVGVGPSAVAISPDGSRVYVAGCCPGMLVIVDTAAAHAVSTIGVGVDPIDVAVRPDGAFVYVANSESDSVSVVDAAAGAVVQTVAVGDFPRAVAVSPAGDFAYVSATLADAVSVIATASNEVVATIPVGDGPAGIAFGPDSRAYVANLLGDTVSVIDTASAVSDPAGAVIAEIPVPSRPLQLALTLSGAKLFITHSVTPGLVSVIDTASLAVVDTVAVGNNPSGIAIGEVLTRP